MKTIKRIKWMLAICLLNMHSIFAQIGNLVDDPSKEWCYLKKSTTVIGMPFNPQVTEVTYDGSLYTGYAELCFHYGKNDTPILIRQKTFKDGWIPVVGDCWKDGNIQYQIEMFAAPLNDSDVSNCINFVKITMSNTGKEKATGYFNISTRGKVDDYRLAELKNFSEDNLYEIQNGKVKKDNKMLFTILRISKFNTVFCYLIKMT